MEENQRNRRGPFCILVVACLLALLLQEHVSGAIVVRNSVALLRATLASHKQSLTSSKGPSGRKIGAESTFTKGSSDRYDSGKT